LNLDLVILKVTIALNRDFVQTETVQTILDNAHRLNRGLLAQGAPLLRRHLHVRGLGFRLERILDKNSKDDLHPSTKIKAKRNVAAHDEIERDGGNKQQYKETFKDSLIHKTLVSKR
jgi:hypothetical protein